MILPDLVEHAKISNFSGEELPVRIRVSPNSRASCWEIPSVVEDPFINAQMDAGKVNVGKPKTVGNNLDMVEVVPFFRGNFEGPPVKVYCSKVGDAWKIANIVYPGDPAEGIEGFDLKGFLNKGLEHSSSSFQGEDPSTMISPEEEAAENRAANLAGALQGTWVHKSTSKTADGTPRPLDIAVIKWTFKPGGKCDFYQKVGSGKPMIAEDREYVIEDQTITLGSRTKYTVVKNMGDKMIWKNHRLGDFFHVERE